MQPSLIRDVAGFWRTAKTGRRTALASILLLALLLAALSILHVCKSPDAFVYLPAYLIFINLFRSSWMRYLRDSRQREQLFIAIGLSISILRYPLLFTPVEPYLDFMTVASFYFFAYSQTLVLQEPRRSRLVLNAAFAASMVFYAFLVGQYWTSLIVGPRPYLLTRAVIETQVGPVWLLASITMFIGFLLFFHVRAAVEIDDFAIRLRLGFLIVTWLLFLVFFILDEGYHFGWFSPDRHLSDIFLVLPIVCIGLGLAMPRLVERCFASMHFLDRRTSRELTLFVLTQIVRHSTGSPLTELSLAVAERLGLTREERLEIHLACEFLETGYPAEANTPAAEASWEQLAVASTPERRRLADEQRLVFRAWRLKRAVEAGIPATGLNAKVIAAARDYLLGKDRADTPHEQELWAVVCLAAQAAVGQQAPPPDLFRLETRVETAVGTYEKKVSQRTGPLKKR